MFNKIMVAYDDGAVAARALDTAIALAQATGGEIYIVSAYMTVDNPSRREKIEKVQAAAAEKAIEAGICVHKKIEAGGKELGQTIAKVADDLKADTIVMGTNNRGAVGRVMFGSVSEYILRNVACPVLIVK